MFYFLLLYISKGKSRDIRIKYITGSKMKPEFYKMSKH